MNWNEGLIRQMLPYGRHESVSLREISAQESFSLGIGAGRHTGHTLEGISSAAGGTVLSPINTFKVNSQEDKIRVRYW